MLSARKNSVVKKQEKSFSISVVSCWWQQKCQKVLKCLARILTKHFCRHKKMVNIIFMARLAKKTCAVLPSTYTALKPVKSRIALLPCPSPARQKTEKVTVPRRFLKKVLYSRRFGSNCLSLIFFCCDHFPISLQLETILLHVETMWFQTFQEMLEPKTINSKKKLPTRQEMD